MCKSKRKPLSGQSIRKMLSLRNLDTSQALIAKDLGVDPSTVSKWFKKADQLSLTWEEASKLSDAELEDRFNGTLGRRRTAIHPVDFDSFVAKAGRGKKIERVFKLYLKEAAKTNPSIKPVSRQTFFRRVKEYRHEKKSDAMLMVWEPKVYMQIDMCGNVIELMPDADGKPVYCYVFVANLPCTGMVFAKALPGCTSADWCEAIVEAFKFFKGRTDIILCDNDKALAARAVLGDQELTQKFAELSGIYGFDVEFARPGTPQDKAAVEASVGDITDNVIVVIKPRSMKECDDVQRVLDREVAVMNGTPNGTTGVSPADDFRTREQPLLIKVPPYVGWTRQGRRRRRRLDDSRCVKVDGHIYLMPHGYGLRTIDVVETEDKELLFLKPGSSVVEIRYTHFEKKNNQPEGFKHAKPECRGPNEVTPEEQLKRELEKFSGFGENAKRYAAKYVAARARKSKRMVAQQLSLLRHKTKGLDGKVVESACSHALAMNDFDKENFPIYLDGARRKAEMDEMEKAAKEGRKRDKPTYKGACLRTASPNSPQFPRLKL